MMAIARVVVNVHDVRFRVRMGDCDKVRDGDGEC
jgi:hypothetical protein